MTKLPAPLFLAAVAAAAAAPAHAQIREVSPGHYLCDAAAGEVERADVSGFFGSSATMTARVRMLEARRNERAYSSASLNFELDTGRSARVLVLASPDGRDFLWVGILPPVDADGIQISAYRTGRTVEITGTMARGAVFARSGNDRGQIYVGEARLTGRTISCSSGRFEIELAHEARRARRY
ncbi:MAG TPA: hypothetical protein VGX37_06450 [Allosphingosinicella sp.]|jgi:hypothetical protein|nr:hypothetical protein [Allosphingosinicella sp.]